jgi:hypothetical protein
MAQDKYGTSVQLPSKNWRKSMSHALKNWHVFLCIIKKKKRTNKLKIRKKIIIIIIIKKKHLKKK